MSYIIIILLILYDTVVLTGVQTITTAGDRTSMNTIKICGTKYNYWQYRIF